MDELILPLDAFVRSVGINKSTPHLLFLGAGASVSSGVPSAERCIWEWKRRIFLTRNPGLEEQFSEKVRQARPHIGYRLLCHLAQMDMVRAVWTTNFDGLPVRPPLARLSAAAAAHGPRASPTKARGLVSPFRERLRNSYRSVLS